MVARAMDDKQHALIEAGTGSGKSFGYLVPILLSGRVAVISTGTIALQEQLLNNDLPFLEQAFGRKIKVALAKGRGNYICFRKLDEAHRTVALTDPQRPVVEDLIELSRSGSWSGDRADLPFVVDSRLWMDLLSSDPEDCLGPKCPNFVFTPHRLARQKVEEAEIIIANHALYFTDLVMEGSVLPKHDLVVFDEAHHLERAASAALTVQVAKWMAGRLLQRVQRRFSGVPLGLVQEIVSAEDGIMDILFRQGRGQYRLEPESELSEAAARMGGRLERLAQWLGGVDPDQMLLPDADPGLAKARAELTRDQMLSVTLALMHRWQTFATLDAADERANWMYLDPTRDHYELNSAPLEVGEELQKVLWAERTAILTSATLAVDGKFDFVKRELGLGSKCLEAVLGSPFDYQRQALLYVPAQVPPPNDPDFTEGVLPEIEAILNMTRGRAFVLCTSYRSLREIHQALAGRLPFPMKTQEELPRARLIEWFKSTPNAVLIATGTFWEGVDIPGESLSCVIICKLPFSSPDDPVVKARTDRMKARNEDWFGGYVLPKAVLALKQGFGRLIRTRSDTGIVAILDRRLVMMRYGAMILRSLPPARRVLHLADSLEAALAAAPQVEARAPQWDRSETGISNRSAPPADLDSVLGPPRDY